jgi:hypothetical protein
MQEVKTELSEIADAKMDRSRHAQPRLRARAREHQYPMRYVSDRLSLPFLVINGAVGAEDSHRLLARLESGLVWITGDCGEALQLSLS